MDISKVLEFARECEYDTVEYKGIWRGYEVYRPGFELDGDDDCAPRVGIPSVILVKGEAIRLSDVEETWAYFDDTFVPEHEEDLPGDWDEEEEKNPDDAR